MHVPSNETELENLCSMHELQKDVTALFGLAEARSIQYECASYGNMGRLVSERFGFECSPDDRIREMSNMAHYYIF